MINMTVLEFLNAFVSRYAAIRVMHFPQTDASAEVLYEGFADCSNIPDDVKRRVVSSVIAIDFDLCIAVYKEDEQ